MSPRGVGLPDELLGDRYQLVERIAVGGMGEVWRAEDVLLGRPVAVKTLKPEYLGDADFRARFRAEARHAGRLAHPGIASVYDFGESDSSAWLVMELVDGEPLSSLLHREGSLSVDRTLDLVAQAADALQTAHEGGVVHRDVKPGNLLVRPDGVLKVTDFGIASATDAVPLTRTGTVVGTAYYLSPEQAAGRSGSPASDLYALGVVAYECLCGRRPFPGDNPVAVALAHLRESPPPMRASVPGQVQDLVLRALAKDPADRFADAADLSRRAAGLRGALAGGPGSTDAEDGGLAAVPVAPPPAAQVPHEAVLLSQAPTSLLDIPAAPEPRHPPGSRSRSSRRAVSVVGALLVVLAVGLGVRAGSADLETDTAAGTRPTGTAATSPTPVRIPVDPALYLGRPAVEARTALADRGLVPRLSYDGSGQPVGTVSAVEPSGPLDVGTAVLLRVVPEPPPAPVEVAPEPEPVRAPQVEPEKVLPPAVTDKGKGRGKR